MSARRERVPLTGRSNLGALASPIAKNSARVATAGANIVSARREGTGSNPVSARSVGQTHSARIPQTSARMQAVASDRLSNRDSQPGYNLIPRSSRGPESARSDVSDLSVAEVLRRLRDKADIEKNASDQHEIDALGDYNAFSRPRVSLDIPLRSILLDPTVNNFPKSRTRTELLKKIRVSGAPHPSYDLDRDGYVSQEDYRLAKRFDFDGNGVLDPDERAIGKQVLADEFFKDHAERGDLACFGEQFTKNTHKKNVDSLANAYSFERAYDRLLSVERTIKAGSSEPILECMRTTDTNLTKHNFYVNKFDSTAWNDFDAIPRAASNYGLDDHGGSRKRLLFSRRQASTENNQRLLDIADSKKTMPNTRRMNLITNVAVENS